MLVQTAHQPCRTSSFTLARRISLRIRSVAVCRPHLFSCSLCTKHSIFIQVKSNINYSNKHVQRHTRPSASAARWLGCLLAVSPWVGLVAVAPTQIRPQKPQRTKQRFEGHGVKSWMNNAGFRATPGRQPRVPAAVHPSAHCVGYSTVTTVCPNRAPTSKNPKCLKLG
jgi:hypothetical protein